MCLAVPGRVVSVEGADPAFRNAQVDFSGVRRTVNLAFTPEVVPGDFVIVPAGVWHIFSGTATTKLRYVIFKQRE